MSGEKAFAMRLFLGDIDKCLSVKIVPTKILKKGGLYKELLRYLTRLNR